MNDSKNIDPREVLRRLDAFLDDDLTDVEIPTDEEARAICAEVGIDIDAAKARLLAMIAAHEAGLPLPSLKEEPPPKSHVAARPARAPGLRHRARR